MILSNVEILKGLKYVFSHKIKIKIKYWNMFKNMLKNIENIQKVCINFMNCQLFIKNKWYIYIWIMCACIYTHMCIFLVSH